MAYPTRCLALAVGMLALVPPLSAAGQAERLTAAVDSVLDSLVAADRFSGTVLIARGDRVLFERALGLADRERGQATTLDTRLEIASMTKLLTRIAILQLAQAGRLSLSDTVGRFLPGYPNPVVRSKVTVEQLPGRGRGTGDRVTVTGPKTANPGGDLENARSDAWPRRIGRVRNGSPASRVRPSAWVLPTTPEPGGRP